MKYSFFLILVLPLFVFSQQSINGTFSPAEDYSYVFLYRSTPTSSDFVDRAQIDSEGNFSIALDSSVTAGIYKIIYALPPEDNNFDLIYNGKESVSLRFSLDKGLEFTEGMDNKLWSSYNNSMEMVNSTISNYYMKQSTDEKAFHDIFKTLNDTQTAFEEASKGTLAATFIKANTPYIPEAYENLSTYSNNLKRTYLSYVDFNNNLLQSSDFIVDRIFAYIFGMTENSSNETYKVDIDDVMTNLATADLDIKTMLVEMVWNRFVNMNNTEIANYISDNYLMDLAKEGKNMNLFDKLEAFSNNQIGKKAQNFDLTYSNAGNEITTTLHDLDIASQYLIIFWSSTCSHCLEELPKVKELLKQNTETKVIAIGLEEDGENWKKAIVDYPDFIHVLGLGKWDNPISNNYGIEGTPSFILLNAEKKIIAKPSDTEALKASLE